MQNTKCICIGIIGIQCMQKCFSCYLETKCPDSQMGHWFGFKPVRGAEISHISLALCKPTKYRRRKYGMAASYAEIGEGSGRNRACYEAKHEKCLFSLSFSPAACLCRYPSSLFCLFSSWQGFAFSHQEGHTHTTNNIWPELESKY